MRVFANGKTQKSFLTLSPDKFTLYLTTERKTAAVFSLFGRTKPTTVQERAIDIGAIDRIQRGHATKRFEMARKSRQESFEAMLVNGTNTNELNPSQCFSILFRGDWTLDLMMLSSNRDEVLDAIDQILETYQTQKRRVSNDVLLLRYHWLDAVSDKEKAHHVNTSELQKLLIKMNYKLKPKEFNDHYDKFVRTIGLGRKHRRHGITFEQACTFLHKLKRDSWIVKPINVYWNQMFGEVMKNGKPRMHVSEITFLEKFVHEIQGEIYTTTDDVHRLFHRLNSLELPYIAGESSARDPTRIDKNRFEAYLYSEENDAFDPQRQKFRPDSMNRPISEYWINSSHNTYLTGDQLTSNSSVDMYSNALYRGCRCLELDVWDGDLDDEGIPRAVVWHGHTMTSKILFIDIIKALKLFLNFHPDSFPIILSFENHCSIPYQEVMADQLVHVLGKMLYIPKEESLLSGRLPSPMELRGMVVIKGRRPSNLNYDDYDTDDDVSDDGAPSTIYGSENQGGQPPEAKAHHSICPALARLTLFHGSKFTTWEGSKMNPTHHMHSFSENKVRTLARKTHRDEWTIYNQTHMCRTYPAGSRIDSSNYMPILPWSVGCQLVSLNFQTNDTALLLNDGRFRENGGCGYVLKPTSLLELQLLTQKNELPKPMKLSIRVLSGSCLPKPKDKRGDKCIDPYVRVSVFDVKNGVKEEATTYQTGVVYNNGFFPIWNEEGFKFTVESWPSAMLHLTIYDKEVPPSSDEFVATSAIPISCLRQGLRSVKLNDLTNTRSGAFDFASLLIDVKKSWGNEADLARRSESFGNSAHNKTEPLRLERARTDNSKGPPAKYDPRADTSFGATKPDRMERSRTETSRSSTGTTRTGGIRVEKSKLVRAKTDQATVGDDYLAEF